MNLSSFYSQVSQDHAKAVKGLRDSQKMPHQRQYKSIKAISSNGETVYLYSSLGNAKVTTKYHIKDKNKAAKTEFKLFNNLIATLETQKSQYSWIYKFNVHILGLNWLSRSTFRHLNMLFNTYEVTTSGKRAIGSTLRAFTKNKISFIGSQEINEFGVYEAMYY
tara:strand:+ start:102 stop:593 length:492 start_codon:yes stop_codon:yes gene_type:complete